MQKTERRKAKFSSRCRRIPPRRQTSMFCPLTTTLTLPKENTIIATSKPVILLFSKYHDEDNTIPAELKDVEALKNAKAPNCVKATYNGNRDRIMMGGKIFRRDTVCHFASLRKSIDYFSLLSLYN